jgi:anaerobic magnesium-protoporphyrin IX monomethyl ester cyclase
LEDILLTHSYHLPYDPKQVRKMQPYRPVGTLFAAAALRSAGFSVALFDTMLSDPEKEFAEFFAEHTPRILVVYEDDFNFLSKMCLTRMREVVWHIAKIGKKMNVPVIAHGSDASDCFDMFLSHGIDYVLRGEAEQSLVTLCGALIRGETPGKIDGLVGRGRNGSTQYLGQPVAKNPDWTALPVPPRDLTDFRKYRSVWQQAHGYFSVNMVASRGCPYSCNWCAKPISGTKFRLRSASDVAEEMLQLKTEAAADHIWFSDDVFALNRHWVREFAAEVNAKNAVLPFKIQSRADLMTEDTVEALRLAGCHEVWMGVESGSQEILHAMDKGLLISDIYAARQRLRKANIRACYFLQFGYPGEGWQELLETIQLVRDTRPDDVGISFSYPLPGTVFYERVKKQLGSKRNWSDSDDLCIMFHGAYTTEFYRAVRDALHAEVDSWSVGSAQSDAIAPAVNEMWQRAFALEPVSKNPSALVTTDTSVPDLSCQTELIPVHHLTRSLGV